MKKSFKKFLAVFLAVVMIASSVPFATIVASAATTNITAAIEAFEAKLDGTKVYTNMTAAYNAYVDANAAYDAYVYGYNTGIDLDGYATTLNNAVANMSEWTPYTGTGTATMGTSTIPSTAYANLLYGNGSSDTDYSAGMEVTSGSVIKYGCYGYVYYPETTLLYDGTTTPVMPVASGYIDAGKRYDCNPGLMVTTTSGLAMVNSTWVGYTDGFTWNTATDNTISAVAGTISGSTSMGNTSTKRTYSNSMSYTGTPTSTITQITSTDWTYAIVRNSASGTFTNSTKTITIINYKQLIDAIDTNKSKLDCTTKDYDEGGLASVIAAFDAATSLDPNSYFTSSNDYTSCGAAIDTAVANLGSATGTEDTSDYQALRDAIELAAPTYFAGNADNANYTEDSWATFETECLEAVAVMQALTSNGYVDQTSAATEAAELTAAYHALETTEVKVEVTELETAIDNALAAIKYEAYFTTDSFAAANLATVVENAQVAIWQAVANYKVEAYLPADNADNQALVAQHLALVKEAVAKLVINCDTEVATASNYSLNSAVEYAGTLTAADYSNYAAVTEAVANANSFKNSTETINASVEGSVETKVNTYIDVVEALNISLRDLKPAFSKIANGTMANSGTLTSTSVGSYNDSDKWRLDLGYYNGQIFFRTTHDAATFDMSGMVMNFVTDRDYDQMLDSISLNDTSSPTYSNEDKGELNAVSGSVTGGDPSGFALDATTIASVPGNLTLNNAGGTFALSDIKVHSGSSDDGVLGKDGSGNSVTDSSYDFTSLLATTNGTEPIAGGITAKNGTTTITASYTLSFNASTAKTLSASTLPTSTTYAPTNVNFGMVYYYKYVPTAIQKYAGYAHAKTTWSPSATVIDISYLIDLIDVCDTLDASAYTTSSWNALATALTAAKSDMDYGNMTADAITTECQTRYTNLWNAYQALEVPASNTELKAAIEATKATYNTGNVVYSTDSWATFKSAYETATGKLGNEYSDINIRNVAASEQDTVDSYATALTDAYNALVKIKSYVTFVDASGATIETTLYDVGATVTIPANTATAITDTDHTIYVWPTVGTVTAEDVTYTETSTTTSHTYEITDYLTATCTTDGYNTYTCTECNNSYTETVTSGDHNWVLVDTLTAATCQAEGEGEYECSYCYELKTDVIPVADHAYTQAEAGDLDYVEPNYDSDTPVSCQDDGYAYQYCDWCYDEGCPEYREAWMEASEIFHDWPSKATTTVKATCTTDGYKIYTCSTCGETKQETYSTATGHTAGTAVQENVVAATCTTAGSYESVVYCSVCNTEISRETITVDATGAHTAGAAVKENVVAETGAADGSYESVVYCSVCNTEISRETITVDEIDASAYEAALATVETTMAEATYEAKYTAESRAAFEEAVANAKIDLATTTTQDAIDNAAEALTTALTLLQEAPQGYTVTFDVITDDAATATTSTDGYIYGEAITLDATSYVADGTIYKWTVEDNDTGATTKIELNDVALDFVVTSNMTVTVYIASTPEDTTDYKRVSLYGPTGTVIGVGYVPADETFTYDASAAEIEINGMTFTAPSRAFYTFAGWVVKSESDSELKLKSTYTFVEGEDDANVCYVVGIGDVKVNGVENYKANYDESLALTGASNYAIATLVDGEYVVSTYLVTNRMHAPHEQTVYVIAVDSADIVATTTITGAYTESRETGKITVAFNNAFLLPENAVMTECGTIATAREAVANDTDAFVLGGTGVNQIKSEKQTKLNEYTTEFTLPTGVTSTLYGRSYLVYTVDGVEYTIYSDVVSVAL